MVKINKKSFPLVAIVSLVALGLVCTGFLVAMDLQASAGRPTGVAFAGHGAWSEHHHFDISAESGRGEDAFQTLYAKIKNYMDGPFPVKAQFNITLEYDPISGMPKQYTIYTPEESLNPGSDTVLPADFGPLNYEYAGTWDVIATCLYSLDGGQSWSASDTKVFKFTIVP